jgi:hypothetical protein
MPARKKALSLDKQQLVSAQVVLRPESGKSIRGNVPITSQNLKDYLPSLETTKKVAQAFTESGFTVGSLIGNSFPISASVKVFESVFKTRLRQDERGAILATGRDQAAGLELPLSALPKEISDYIEAVTFTPPPDFGPTPSGSW